MCIVGAGPAGLAIAAELDGGPLSVCLLESGGLSPDPRIDDLSDCAAEDNDDLYMNTRYARSRAIGGTAHRWCVDIEGEIHFRLSRLHPGDLDDRPWLPGSGWPLSPQDLEPYYERAMTACGVDPVSHAPIEWTEADRHPIDFPSGRVESVVFSFAPQRTFLVDLPAKLKASRAVTICSQSTAVELIADDDGSTIERIRVRTLNGNQFFVEANHVVLAQGGHEVPRLLLTSTSRFRSGIGNEHDLVGRFYMDHQILKTGRFDLAASGTGSDLSFYDIRRSADTLVTGAFTVADKVMDDEQLLRSAFIVSPRPSLSPATILGRLYLRETTVRSPAHRSALTLKRSLVGDRRLPSGLVTHLGNIVRGADDLIFIKKRSEPFFRPRYSIDEGGWSDPAAGSRPFSHFDVFQLCEQGPDPDNRLELTEQADALGVAKTRVRFTWREADRASACRSQEILAEELSAVGLGELELHRRGDYPLVRQMTTHHPAGGTRMAADPADGVVDANCQVHGFDNLHIASSSVFPTAGYATPTLTVIALGIRIADRIRHQLGVSTGEPQLP